MVQIITTNGGGGGGGGASYTAGNGIDITNNEISVDTSVVAEKSDLSGYQTTANMVCDLTGADNSHYPSAKAVSDALQCAGAGDMLKSVYDPNNVSANAFDYDNFINTPTIPTDNCQLANGCGYAKTGDIPTDNCQLSNGCGYTTCTGTLTSSNISNTAYGSSWSGVVTDAPSKKVMYDKLKTYDAIIPSAATCSNQLTDKNYVDDSINSVTAYYITKNAQGDQFACYAELAAATTFYSGGVQRTPTRNDYTIVADDECYSDATTRYIYNSGWEYQYTVNETPLTTAQLNALNSGITAAKVTCYDAIPVITNNCQIANGCGYTTCTGTLSSCADVISALGYTPYNSSNPSGYVTSSIINDTAYGIGWDADTTHAPTKNAVYDKISSMDTTISGKQDTLVSGTNIKTINGDSILGSGDISIGMTITQVLNSTSDTKVDLRAYENKLLYVIGNTGNSIISATFSLSDMKGLSNTYSYFVDKISPSASYVAINIYRGDLSQVRFRGVTSWTSRQAYILG